jgi:hypothetical protein
MLGMTVAQLREVISNREYVQWQVYLGRRGQQQDLANKVARARR